MMSISSNITYTQQDTTNQKCTVPYNTWCFSGFRSDKFKNVILYVLHV